MLAKRVGGMVAAWAVIAIAAESKLELQSALPLEGTSLAQPSGLAFDGKGLLMVCAFHDDDIYRIELQADKVVFKEAIHIRRPKDAEGMKLAWRGISAAKGGGFLLASSQACRIMMVEADGDAEWMGPSMLETGAEKGLFVGEQSGIEGVVPAGKKKYMIAASREPRGILDLDMTGPKPVVTAWLADKTRIPLPTGRRKADFADLAEENGQIWALCANSDAIAQVKWNGQEYIEGAHWSFGHVSNDPKFKYAGLRMGLARGLAMDGQSIYIALDNKGVGRQADPADKRPILLVFNRPKGV